MIIGLHHYRRPTRIRSFEYDHRDGLLSVVQRGLYDVYFHSPWQLWFRFASNPGQSMKADASGDVTRIRLVAVDHTTCNMIGHTSSDDF